MQAAVNYQGWVQGFSVGRGLPALALKRKGKSRQSHAWLPNYDTTKEQEDLQAGSNEAHHWLLAIGACDIDSPRPAVVVAADLKLDCLALG